MQETITVPLEEYEELKHKAEILQEIMEEEKLTIQDLEKIKQAEKSRRISKTDFYSRHPELRD